MRRVILMPVEHTFCDAHISRDGSEVEAVKSLTLDYMEWDLCVEHVAIFSRYLTDALGVPAAPESETAEADSLPAPIQEQEQGEPEVESDAEQDSEEASEEPKRSVMITGEIPGYDWETARDAVRDLGYEVVGRADDTTVLIICGTGAERNTTKLRDARNWEIPCMDATVSGVFMNAVEAGQLAGGDPLPEPARNDAEAVRSTSKNEAQAVREWAANNGYKLASKGRIPMHVTHAFKAANRASAIAA